MSARELGRLLRVARVLVRHGLLDLVPAAHRGRASLAARLLLVRPDPALAALPRGERLTRALTRLGPMFVKFGQILSTRRDLVPPDVADALAALQDRVAPFPGEQARAAVERALGAPVSQLFSHFDESPLASASIAQVHAASLHPRQRDDGSLDAPAEVVVKVLRPDIAERASADIALLRSLAALVRRFHPAADKLRPDEVVDELEDTLRNELDLEREGANASLLRRNFKDSPDLKVPAVVWPCTRAGVLVLERVHGIPVDDLAALDAAGIDRKALAAKGVRLFYEQVFRDNFFHADAHAGNIWVDPDRRGEPRFIALDFGIMGSLPDEDRYWLAENFLALFRNDYARIAELHVRAGWMPADVRMDELEAAIRTVCEPYFTRPLSEISLAELVMKLFETARRYQLTLQPQLILLQKTLLNIEGVGRMLDPQIDIWAVARPVLERIWRRRHGPRAALRSLRRHAPEWLTAAPRVPGLVHQLLVDATTGKLELRMASGDLKALERRLARGQRAAFWRGVGLALGLLAVVLGFFIEGARLAGLAAAVAALVAFLVAGRLSALPPSTRSIRRIPT